MKLRSKHGWLVLLAEEMDGNTTVLMPTLDPLVISRQLSKLKTRPHATVLYISRLQMVFEEAQRPLKSLRWIAVQHYSSACNNRYSTLLCLVRFCTTASFSSRYQLLDVPASFLYFPFLSCVELHIQPFPYFCAGDVLFLLAPLLSFTLHWQ